MSDFTLKETNQYYRTKLNTYTFNIVSPSANSNTFNVIIPPFPLPTHQRSSLAIFKLKEFWIVDQGDTAAERSSGLITTDITGFIVRFKGLGLRGTNFSNCIGSAVTPIPSQDFIVINKYNAGGVERESLQLNSGNGYLTHEVVCSNPTGTDLIIEVRDLQDESFIIPANFFVACRFEIEVIPDEIGRGDFN